MSNQNPKFRAVWQTLKTVQVAHLTNDEYERYTREENEKALEKYKCDTIEGTVIIKGVRYVTSEILDSFEEICDAIPKEWLLPPMSREHLDRPCEGAWWGQRKALELLQKTSKNKICMIEATQTLDTILKSSRGKRKKTPLKAYYCDVNGEITYLLYKAKDDTYCSTIRDPQGRLHKQKEVPLVGNPIPTAQWRDGHTYIQLPRPKEYTLGGIGAPLDRISVKQLTLEFSKDRHTLRSYAINTLSSFLLPTHT
eukprot:scaffold3717_cov124-Isochrysis_galbana.AAC.7